MDDNDSASRSLGEALQKATQLLDEITALRNRAESAAVAAEVSNSKANSESGFAFNAKENAEAHAKAISQVRGSVDADSNWLTTTKVNAEEVAQAITRARVSSENDVQMVLNSRTSAEQDAKLATVARDSVERNLSAIATSQAEVNDLLTRANEAATSLNSTRLTIEAHATTVQTLQSQMTEAAAKAQNDVAMIASREAESQTIAKSLSEVNNTAKEAQSRVADYEKYLQVLKGRFDELHAKTEALLPGATSAGLATSFRDQKARFDQPQKNWLGTFIGAVVLLLFAGLVGLPGFWLAGGGTERPSWDTMFRHFISRLPLVAPLVWLGVYAGRNYMLALRMQEEYAFKEAISATFEGYKREMESIQGADVGVRPLMTLCENVLLTLAQRPGRIYESRQEDITPWAPLTKVIEEVVTKAIKAAKPE